MKRSSSLLAVCLAAFGLTGCVPDFSSPKKVLTTSYMALQRNDSKTFFRTLKGEASKKYSSLEAMLELKKELDAYRAVYLGTPTLVEEGRDQYGRLWRFYDMELTGYLKSQDPAHSPQVTAWHTTTACLMLVDKKDPTQVMTPEMMDCRIIELEATK